jgi:hypothetical protein
MVRIENTNLNSIEIEYNKELKKTFLKKIDNIYKVLNILTSSTPINEKTVEKQVNELSSALLAVTGHKKLLNSKVLAGDGKKNKI